MSIKTTRPVADAEKLGGQGPGYYAKKEGPLDTVTVAAIRLGDGALLTPDVNSGGTSICAKGQFGVVDVGTRNFTRVNAKDYRLFTSAVGREALLSTNTPSTGYKMTLCSETGSCCTNLSGSTYNNFTASNITSSSERYKENIREMTDGEAEQILQVVSVAFDWKEGTGFSGASFSFVAERLAEIDERFIYRNEDGKVEGILVNPIIAAQNHIIRKHEDEITKIKTENTALKVLLVEKGICTQEEIAGLEAKLK